MLVTCQWLRLVHWATLLFILSFSKSFKFFQRSSLSKVWVFPKLIFFQSSSLSKVQVCPKFKFVQSSELCEKHKKCRIIGSQLLSKHLYFFIFVCSLPILKDWLCKRAGCNFFYCSKFSGTLFDGNLQVGLGKWNGI